MTLRELVRYVALVVGVTVGCLLLLWILVGMTSLVLAREFCWDTSAGAEVYRLYVAPVPLVDWVDPETGEVLRTTTAPVFNADDRLSFMASCCQSAYCCAQVEPERFDELVYYFVTADNLAGNMESDVAMRERLVTP